LLDENGATEAEYPLTETSEITAREYLLFKKSFFELQTDLWLTLLSFSARTRRRQVVLSTAGRNVCLEIAGVQVTKIPYKGILTF